MVLYQLAAMNGLSEDYWRIINQVSLCVQQAANGPIKTFVHVCYFVFTITKEIYYICIMFILIGRYKVYSKWANRVTVTLERSMAPGTAHLYQI